MDIELLTESNTVIVWGRFLECFGLIRCPPRHSHLGPLLFSFADDAHIYRSISSRKDADTLQKDLDKLGEWEKNWSMEFHFNKCQLLRITNKCKIVDAHYMIHGKRLKLVDSAKYLGVTLTKNLSWKNHIRIITAKANNTWLFLQKNLVKIDRKTKLKCYYTYIRPVLEYASTGWNPVDQTNPNFKTGNGSTKIDSLDLL